MSELECNLCNFNFDKDEHRPFMLECGDSACLKCIKYHKNNNIVIKCNICCEETSSMGKENKSLLKKLGQQQTNSQPKQPQKDEFEITIRKTKKTLDGKDKFGILVKKNMTVEELKNKIQKEQNIPATFYDLAFKKPLSEEKFSLESYGITKTVTVTMIVKFDGGI